MTDNEIIKDCKNCLHYDICLQWSTEPLNNADWCIHFIDENIINRLKADNERLNEEIRIRDEIIDYRGAEVLRHDKCIRTLHEKMAEAKSEARKEFVERLKEKAFIKENPFEANEDKYIKLVTVKDIDNLLKEMGCE